jgi:phosphate-selective porin OprO/OprP
LFGGEYDWLHADTPDGQHPTFHGGNAVVTYLLTGETRAYNLQQAFFYAVSPRRSVYSRGPGAVEAVLNFSYADYDSGNIQGGKLARLTPMINWFLSDNLRLEFVYGYSVLAREGLKGRTQFFQLRLQMVL